MPWKAVGNKIERADTGKVVGHSKSHEMAKRAVKARYANSSPRDKALAEYNKRHTVSYGGDAIGGCG